MASHSPLLSRLLPPSHFFFLLLPWLLISLPNLVLSQCHHTPVIFYFSDCNSNTPNSSSGSASQSTSPMVVPSFADQLVISPMDVSIFSVSHHTRPLLWILISSSSAGGGRVALQEKGWGPSGGRWQGRGLFQRQRTARKGFFQRGVGVQSAGDDNSGRKKKNWTGRFGRNRLVYPVHRSNHRFNRPNSDLNTFWIKWPDRTGFVTGRRSDWSVRSSF